VAFSASGLAILGTFFDQADVLSGEVVGRTGGRFVRVVDLPLQVTHPTLVVSLLTHCTHSKSL
jgi:hypothetical protein